MNRLGFFARRFNSVARTFTENSPATFPSVKETMAPHAYSEYQHAYKSTNTWFYLNFAITIPGLAAALYFCVPPELEHLNHLLEHPREFEDLPYMRKRKTPFPWGDNSLFHNDNANPSRPLPPTPASAQIADISFKIEVERKVLQGASIMHKQLADPQAREACEANMVESKRRIEYFEGLLRDALMLQNGQNPRGDHLEFPGRSSSLPESQFPNHRGQQHPHGSVSEANLVHGQRSTFGNMFGMSSHGSVSSLNPQDSQLFTHTGFDSVKYGGTITTSLVQTRLQDVLHKLDTELKVKAGTENLFHAMLNSSGNGGSGGDNPMQAELRRKMAEGNAKIAMLERAKKRYVGLDVKALAPKMEDGEEQLAEIRRKCYGRLRMKLIGASNLMGRNTSSGSNEIIATVLIDGKLKYTTRSSISRWDETVDLQIDRATEVEISIFSVPNMALLGMQWFKLSDLEDEMNVLYPQGVPSNPNDAAEVWMDIEPAGQLAVKPLFFATKGKAQDGLFRRAAIQKMFPRNGHKFHAVNSLLYQCAVCNEFSAGSEFYQCQGCNYVCHSKCFSNVITKCITLDDIKNARPGTDLNTGQLLPYRIPHRFQQKTIMLNSWCGHCGSMMGPGARIEKCTECGKCSHSHCKPMIPNFCQLKPDVALTLVAAFEDADRRKHAKEVEEAEKAEMARRHIAIAAEAAASIGMVTPPNENSTDAKMEENARQMERLHLEQKRREDEEKVLLESILHAAQVERTRTEMQQQRDREAAAAQQAAQQQAAQEAAQQAAQQAAQHAAQYAAQQEAQYHAPAPVPVQPVRVAPTHIPIPAPLQRHTKLEDFELLSVLGRGAFGKVMLIEEKSTKKLYAMKALKKEFIIQGGDVDGAKLEKRIFQMASQTQHPYLVNMHSCFQSDTRLYFVMEYVSGGDLMCHIMEKRRFSQPRVKFYACEVLLALEFFHANNIIFRDLKLDNILMCADGHIKLADYGICKENIPYGAFTRTFCGTPDYMAPEILSQKKYNRAVDWWSFGVLIYVMLMGKYPYHGEDENDILNCIMENKIDEFPSNMPKETSSLLQGLLTVDPKRRLGGGRLGANEIKRHPYFAGVDWDAFEQRKINPTWRPKIQNERDISNFDSEFTSEKPVLTPMNSVLSAVEQAEFQDFDFTAAWAGVKQ
ncbi:hypothetical protein CcCBS67573_g03186 [Chytriomyces confervae]|uniref:protein kinase C n=1 Tax=Chytriomyces confervae TaxID=246404 RepID=A0A507FH78_9FUNG|nr:hypothetical protein CcCBS67573_g03186 [Chytriomyces confervae]